MENGGGGGCGPFGCDDDCMLLGAVECGGGGGNGGNSSGGGGCSCCCNVGMAEAVQLLLPDVGKALDSQNRLCLDSDVPVLND